MLQTCPFLEYNFKGKKIILIFKMRKVIDTFLMIFLFTINFISILLSKVEYGNGILQKSAAVIMLFLPKWTVNFSGYFPYTMLYSKLDGASCTRRTQTLFHCTVVYVSGYIFHVNLLLT